MARLVIVPDETFQSLVPAMKVRLTSIAGEVTAENLIHLTGEDTIRLIFASSYSRENLELLVWARSTRTYLVAWTSRTTAGEAGAITADLKSGLVHDIFTCGQPNLQSSDKLQASTWTNCEENRGRKIQSVAGAPILLFGRCASVVTLVEYSKDQSSQSLCHRDLAELSSLTSLMGRLLEAQLVRALLGLELQ